MRNPSGGAPLPNDGGSDRVILCPSMRNPSGGAPENRESLRRSSLTVSIDEKPVRRCARVTHFSWNLYAVSIDEKPVRRCASSMPTRWLVPIGCPSMRNPSGGAPRQRSRIFASMTVSIDEKPVRRCADQVATCVGYMLCPSMRNPSGGAPGPVASPASVFLSVHR